MFVRTDEDGVGLHDPDNFRDLHVELGALSPSDAAASLEADGCGQLDGEHCWLEIAWLRSAGVDSVDWRRQFDGMIDFARGQGWVDGAGERVRAHVTVS